MPDREKEPQVTFTDRRKISSDGEIRPEAAAQAEAERRQTESSAAKQASSAVPTASAAPPPEAKKSATAPEESFEDGLPDAPTAQETAESRAAYKETTSQLDELLRAKAPDSPRVGPASFSQIVQSLYMTAMLGLGAGTQPGEKPRIDIMGARQSIDTLAVLGEKTKGNLTPEEQRMLDSALFELRMMFLEITNAIARNAANPAQQPGKRK